MKYPLPLVSFDYDTVKNAAPTRDAIAAALPESERGSFMSGCYSKLFSDTVYWDGADATASHWAAAYLAEREFLELEASKPDAAFFTIVPADHQPVELFGKQYVRSAAQLLTGISPQNEHDIITDFHGRTTFSPGMLMLTEHNRFDVLNETLGELDLTWRATGDAMGIFAAPANWAAVSDFETLIVRACHCPADGRRATRIMAAARILQPGIRAYAAIELAQKFSIAEMEEYASHGIPLEYATA